MPSGATWSKSFGGPGGDRALAVAATSDGGFVFAGTADAQLDQHGVFTPIDGDYWLNKLDANGNSEFARVIGPRRLGIGGETVFKRARALPDGGYILTGYVFDAPGSVGGAGTGTDIAVARLDAAGNVRWMRRHDSGGWLNYEFDSSRRVGAAGDVGVDIDIASDGGYWLVALSTADLRDTGALGFPGSSSAAGPDVYVGARSTVVMRLSADGEVLASRRLTDDSFIDGQKLQPMIRAAADGGALVAQALDHADGQAYLTLYRLSSGADVVWRHTVDEKNMRPNDIIQTDDPSPSGVRDGVRNDGFLVSASWSGDSLVAKFNAAGALEWSDLFESDVASRFPRHSIESVAQGCSDTDAGLICTYAIGGSHQNDSGEPTQAYVALLASDGSLLSQRTLPNASVVVSIDGGEDGAPLRALGRGDGTRLPVSEGEFSLMMLDNPTLAPRSIVPFELAPIFGENVELAAAGPLLFAESQQRLLQFDDAPELIRETLLNAVGERHEDASAVVELAPGRYLLGGATRSFSEIEGTDSRREAWLVRIDQATGVIWQRRLAAGSPGRIDAMTPSGDGGAVLAGELLGARRAVKVDADGAIVWQSTPLLSADSRYGRLYEIRALRGGGYVTAGCELGGPAIVTQVDAQGRVQWSQTYSLGCAESIEPTADGGFAVASYRSDGLADLLKTDAAGQPQWQREFRFAGGRSAGIVKVRQMPDGGFVLGLTERGVASAGVAGADAEEPGNLPLGQSNILLLKIDAAGALQWSRIYGGLYDEQLTDLQALPDGFIVAGWSDSLGDGREAWLLRLGPDGFINAGSCNAYIGAINAEFFSVSTVSPRGEVSTLVTDAVPAASLSDTTETARESSAHVVARQCLGAVTDFPGQPPANATSFPLALQFVGEGAGTVRSDPVLLDCTSDCGGDFPAGRLVVLRPIPAADSLFAGWEDCSLTDGNNCLVLMNQARNVRVRFDSARPALTVTLAGDGAGRVTSDIAGIDCGSDCSEPYGSGARIVLTAAPGDTSSFTGWTGCDDTAGPDCFVTMSGARQVVANFRRLPTEPPPGGTTHVVSVQMNPASRGIGLITSVPALFQCAVEFAFVQAAQGGDCAFGVASGTTITLIATPEAATTFDSWSGCDSMPSARECQVIVAAPRTVTARFNAP